MVANKADLDTRKIFDQEIKEFESKKDIKVIETSAKNSFQVDMAFRTVCEMLINKRY